MERPIFFWLTNRKFFECCNAPSMRTRNSAKISAELTKFLCFSGTLSVPSCVATKADNTRFRRRCLTLCRIRRRRIKCRVIKIASIQLGAYGLSRTREYPWMVHISGSIFCCLSATNKPSNPPVAPRSPSFSYGCHSVRPGRRRHCAPSICPDPAMVRRGDAVDPAAANRARCVSRMNKRRGRAVGARQKDRVSHALDGRVRDQATERER